MKGILALIALASVGFTAAPSYGVAIGLQSANPANARVAVTHNGRSPVRASIVVLDQDLNIIPARAMPSTVMVSRTSKPRKSFIRLPENAYAVCARVEPSRRNDGTVSVAYQSCQKLRDKGKARTNLSTRMGNAFSNN